MTSRKITGQRVQRMVRHWLGTPPNGYLGSDYGSSLPDMLLTPQRSGEADRFVAKLKIDVPVVQIGGNSIGVAIEDVGIDQRRILIESAGEIILDELVSP